MARIAVIIVTRNNPVLLRHAISKYYEHPPGVDCDYYIADASSDNPRQHALLLQQDLACVIVQENDRVEVNFDEAYRRFPGYDYYFFAHDDNVPIQDDWLIPFLKKMESNECEDDVPEEYRELPVGRVGALTHFWRDYHSVRGFPIRCPFLKECLEVITGQPAPSQFRYADCDRVLVSKDCLEATNGLVTLKSFPEHQERLKLTLASHLCYPDQGTYPASKYPPNNFWNRLTLLSEMLNSALPLTKGFRTVGSDSDGYLEEIHGHANPWGHRFIAHYGSPNAIACLSNHLQANQLDVKRSLNDPRVLVQAYKYFRNHYSKDMS